MKMKIYVLLFLSMFISSVYSGGSVTCRSDPTTDNEDLAVDEGDSFTITCDLGNSNSKDEMDSCRFEHYDPLNDNRNLLAADIECAYASGSQSNCYTETRISGTVNTQSCSIIVSNSKPEDTGRWTAVVSTINSLTKSSQQIDVYTYNRSVVEILDENDNRDSTTSVRTSYNWNDKNKDWEDDKGNWETVELTCYASGGRPQPYFTWQINGDDLPDDDIFDNPAADSEPNGQVIRNYGTNDEIQDREAKLRFEVNSDLLSVLNSRYGIDTNPDSPSFDFDIDCVVEQNKQETATETVRIDVTKSYDDGHLEGKMIGMIVGIVLAVIVLVAAIALLIFAKSSAIWCFADDERQYKDPQTSRPRGPPGPHQPQQHQRGRPR